MCEGPLHVHPWLKGSLLHGSPRVFLRHYSLWCVWGGGARKKVQAGYISIVVFSSVQRQEPQRSMQVIQESYRMRVWAQ